MKIKLSFSQKHYIRYLFFNQEIKKERTCCPLFVSFFCMSGLSMGRFFLLFFSSFFDSRLEFLQFLEKKQEFHGFAQIIEIDVLGKETLLSHWQIFSTFSLHARLFWPFLPPKKRNLKEKCTKNEPRIKVYFLFTLVKYFFLFIIR